MAMLFFAQTIDRFIIISEIDRMISKIIRKISKLPKSRGFIENFNI
jgi:hypothetical protein